MINPRSTKQSALFSPSSTSPATCWWRAPCRTTSSPRRRKGSVRGSTSARAAFWDYWSRRPGPSRWWVTQGGGGGGGGHHSQSGGLRVEVCAAMLNSSFRCIVKMIISYTMFVYMHPKMKLIYFICFIYVIYFSCFIYINHLFY